MVSRVGSRHSQLATVRSGMRSNARADVMSEHVTKDLADRTQPLELVENQADNSTGLLIGVKIEPAIWRTNVADRRVQKDLSAPDLVEQPLAHPSAKDMNLRLGHDPGEPQ